MVKTFINQGINSLLRTALAIADVFLQDVLSVQPFAVHLYILIANNETKFLFSLWKNFQTVIALVQLGAVWKKEIKAF